MSIANGMIGNDNHEVIAWDIAQQDLYSILNRVSVDTLQRCVEGRDNGLLDKMINDLEQVQNLRKHKESLKERNRFLACENLTFEPLLNEGKSRLLILHEEIKRISEEYTHLKTKYAEEMRGNRCPTMAWVLLKSASSELDRETEAEADKFFSEEKCSDQISKFIDTYLTKRAKVHIMKIQAEKLEPIMNDPKVNSGFSLI